jgi:membrane-associated phospholipid phosphatase
MATAAQLKMHEGYTQVQAEGVAWLWRNGGDYFTQPLAAMPSLHIAAAVVVSYYAVKARLTVAPLFLAILAWISIESVVARWHYVIDLPAGALVAAIVIALTNRLCRSRLPERASAAYPVADA